MTQIRPTSATQRVGSWGISDRIEKRPLVAFFVLAIAATWTLVSPMALSSLGVIPVDAPRDWHALGALAALRRPVAGLGGSG